ncbi:MAG: SH3 domain-containing protein [Gordonibacter sp.]|uniref:SH3 domain-containing protein n=1 Tax=Gordonibacter sp. TaxID=1968902 RepID=UPI002FC80614
MGLANIAATIHAHLCEHWFHGYTQGDGRWGDGEGVCLVEAEGKSYAIEQGDRDCSSSVIDAWIAALVGTSREGALDAATYTGNMRSVFVGSGLFRWRPMGDGYIAQRGDIYLNEVNHTAMCQSAVPDKLSEFLINENGGIVGGQVGDQTGRESLIRDYYDFPWDGILEYIGGDLSAGNPQPPESSAVTGGIYRVEADHLNVRDRASVSGAVVAGYSAGETVVLDAWSAEADGYLWGRYTSYSGAMRYIAVGVLGVEAYLAKS